jgi:DNA-binding NarL/FixJ family response regulator
MSSGRTVLIVEDEALIATNLEILLEDNGFHVVGWATNSVEAIRAAEASTPAAAVVDIQLRGGDDGVALAAELHRRFGIEIVFVTAQTDHATVERARQVAHRAYINKPYNEQALVEALSAS